MWDELIKRYSLNARKLCGHGNISFNHELETLFCRCLQNENNLDIKNYSEYIVRFYFNFENYFTFNTLYYSGGII